MARIRVPADHPDILRMIKEGRVQFGPPVQLPDQPDKPEPKLIRVEWPKPEPKPIRGRQWVIVQVPPSVNNLFCTARKGKRFRSQAYKEWQQVAIPILKRLTPARSYPLHAKFTVEGPLRAGRDLDNLLKAMLDGSVIAGAIKADDFEHVSCVSIRYRPRRAGAGIRVEFLPDSE